MLSRRREQIVLLLGLVVVNALLAWGARRLWQDYQQRARWIYAPAAPKVASARAPRSQMMPAQSFSEIVDRNMFTPERTIQSPKDEAKAPELPLLYGTMNLGEGWFALMAPGDQAVSGLSKRVIVGEEIGGYKLASISGSRVVVEWNGKTFNIDTAESVRRAARSVASNVRTETAPSAVARASTSASDAPRVTTVGRPVSDPTPFSPGSERQKASAVGNNAPPGAPPDAPPGTVIGGKRKVVNPTPCGDQIFWVDADKPAQGEKKEQ
jgi:hypothetical protein